MPRGPVYTGPLTLSAPGDEEAVRVSTVDLGPYLDAVTFSDQKRRDGHNKPGVGFTIPTEAVTRHSTLFRDAAKQLGLGVSIATFDHTHSKASDWGLTPGQTRIIVTARDRKAPPKPKAESNGASQSKAPAAKTNPMAAKK